MADSGWAVFDTPIGTCGIAWGANGVVGVQLPEVPGADVAGEIATRERISALFPALTERPPNSATQHAIAGVRALLNGGVDDLSSIELDHSGVSEFYQRVYRVVRQIPPGSTRTYGEIAIELGDPTLARAVGQALGRNPFAPVVPCHRVLAAGNKPGGFSATGGVLTKLRMLDIEGARPGGSDPLFTL